MAEAKELVAEKVNTQKLTRFLALVGIAAMLPFFIHLQWLTGTLVNAVLILILFFAGRKYAIFACFIPSLMALAGGLLPAILLPLIPFIMLGNVIYVLAIDGSYNYLRDNFRGYWLGILAGSLAKFSFLYSAAIFLFSLVLKKALPAPIILLVSWPQFATAVIGGMIAWIFLRWLKRI